VGEVITESWVSMKQYEVEITEVLQRRVKITAESEQGAYNKVKEEYSKQIIVLDSSDFVDCEIVIIK
jgi:hypothetical protein